MLGTWQNEVVKQAIKYGRVAYHQVQPTGRAFAYNGRYKTSFRHLNDRVVEWGDETYRIIVGPHGVQRGLAMIAQKVSDVTINDTVHASYVLIRSMVGL